MAEPLHERSREELERLLRAQEQRLRAQEEENAELRSRIEQLEQELSKARKDSSTSSKPPSSDITDRKKQGKGGKGSQGGSKNKKGGQKGHEKHDRKPFSADQVQHRRDHVLDECPHCGHGVEPSESAPRVSQQIDLIQRPIWEVTEHTAHAFWCERCQQVHYAQMPAEVEAGGLFGPRLTAWVAFLKGACHCSYSTIQEMLRDLLGVEVSRGFLVKVVERASRSLEPTHEALGEALPDEPVLNVDETGHKDEGERFWTWCFRAGAFTWFQICSTRGSQVLFDTLGEDFAGTLGSDYFSAYRKYMGECDIRVQFCVAHLIRDLRYLTTLTHPATRSYGQRLVAAVREMFDVIHRADEMTEAEFQKALGEARDAILLQARSEVPDTREAKNIAERFRKHGEAYFRFITTPGLDPTNNLAEQAIRFVIIDRRVTQGTRGERGQRWCERIWTLIASCRQQGRSIFGSLVQAIEAHFRGEPQVVLEPG